MKKAILICLFALVCVAQATWAQAEVAVYNEDDLRAALSDNIVNVINLRSNISLSSELVCNKTDVISLNNFKLDCMQYRIRVTGELHIRNNFNTGTIGTIIGRAAEAGSTFYVESGGTLIIESGNITANREVTYGGVIYNAGTLDIQGGKIYGGNATVGGGIYNTGDMTMFGGTICDNTAGDGGGIYNIAGATLTLIGGNIQNNTSTVHGGSGICNYGTLTVSGGTISGNTSVGNGSGIWTSGNATLNMSGNPVITGNHKYADVHNVYVSEGAVINVTGRFTTGAKIGLTPGGTGTLTSDYATNNSGTDPNTFFSSDIEDGRIGLTDGGEVRFWYPINLNKAIIYNQIRFFPNDDHENLYDNYNSGNIVQVYGYDNGWKRLTKGRDYTFHILNAAGRETTEVIEDGHYTLVVRGIGNCIGATSQTFYVGNDDNEWKEFAASSFSQIDDVNQIVTITSEEELALLAIDSHKATPVYKEWTFLLARDLDLSEHVWTLPIGGGEPGAQMEFLGCFDGQGHTIRGVNLNLNAPGSGDYVGALYALGLFGLIDNGSTVKNLTLADSEIISGRNKGVGGIAGWANGEATIENCHVTSGVNVICTVGDNEAYGGIVGLNYGNIKGCTSAARVFRYDGQSQAFGGLVGHCDISSNGSLTNSIYYGDQVNANSETGAVAGRLGNNKNKTIHCYYTSKNLKGVNGADPNGITQVKAYHMRDVESVDYGGAAPVEYAYGGIKVYSNAMVYDGVVYAQPQYVTLKDDSDAPESNLTGEGTVDSPYFIANAGDWQTFANDLVNGVTFRGKCVTMSSDIRTSVMAGSAEANHPFMGTFNGCGYTIYFEGESAEGNIAPFQSINGATIKNLHTTGLINTGNGHAAGIVANVYGNSIISGCRSDITINATGGEYCGGIASTVADDAQLTIADVLFDGALIGPSATHCGGFVAHAEGTLILNGCLYAPGLQTLGSEGSGTFYSPVDNNHTISACYYTQALGAAQGRRVDESSLRTMWFKDELGNGWTFDYDDGIEIALPAGAKYTTFVDGYALFNSSTKTLTFLSDGQEATHTAENEMVFPLPFRRQTPPWVINTTSRGNLVHVVFDPSFSASRPVSCWEWFVHYQTEIDDIDGLEYLKTSLVNNMERMFNSCDNLQSLDVTHFNTSNVSNMRGMFSGCNDLQSLDVTRFNTSNVNNMKEMFRGCSSLKGLDLSKFDTRNVTTMNSMFDGCINMRTLDLSSFNTQKVTDMKYMFSDCHNLKALNVSSFDTQKVTDMLGMFSSCGLVALDISSFDTQKVTDMYMMFYDSQQLTTIYVGEGWSMDAVTDVGNRKYMFENCQSLVGGRGTSYSANHIDYEEVKDDSQYAHIDGGTANPGYLTAALPTVTLQDAADNSAALTEGTGQKVKAVVQGRTLFKDGSWNTLCLPFDVTLDGSVLHDAEIMTLDNASLSEGTLTLNFTPVTAGEDLQSPAIKAGKPYIVKWEKGADIVNPVFLGVTLSTANEPVVISNVISFQGIYSPLEIPAADNTKLFLGANNTLYWPNDAMTIGAFRAYFDLTGGQQARQFVLNFGEEETGIKEITDPTPSPSPAWEGRSAGWYTLDGRRLDGVGAGPVPARLRKKGIYIYNGIKVVIK